MTTTIEQQFTELLEIKNIILQENLTYDIDEVFEINNCVKKDYEMVGNFITTSKVNRYNLEKSKTQLEVLKSKLKNEKESDLTNSTLEISLNEATSILESNNQKVLLDRKNEPFILKYKQNYLNYSIKVNKMCQKHLFPFMDLPIINKIKNISDIFFSDIDYYNFLEKIFKKILELSSEVTKYRVIEFSEDLLTCVKNTAPGIFEMYKGGEANFLKLTNSHYKFKNHYSLQDSPNQIKLCQTQLVSYVKCLYVLLKTIKTTYRLLNTIIDNIWIDKQFSSLLQKHFQYKWDYAKLITMNSYYYQPTTYWEYFMSNFYSTRIKDNKTFIIRPFGFIAYMNYWFESNKVSNEFYKTSFKYENGKQEVIDFVLFLFSTTEKSHNDFYNPFMIGEEGEDEGVHGEEELMIKKSK